MKKLMLIIAVLSANVSFAQDSWKNADNIGLFNFGNSSSKDNYYDPRTCNNNNPGADHEVRATPPLAPATLLLLGLGGATVGGAVYRNSKRKK